MSRKTILLNGPALDSKSASYGGGKGGAARSMSLYLDGFRSEEFDLQPCFYSVRQKGAGPFSFVARLFGDVREVFRKGRSAAGMHIIAQYRTAIYREFSIVLTCQVLRLPFLYHIKAGIFIEWLNSSRSWERTMALFILRRAKVVLCEGEVYVDYLNSNFDLDSHYFPNFVLDEEVPLEVAPKLANEAVRVLFVGYCYEGKGVFELIDGCELAARNGVSVELTLVGQEHEDFTQFLDARLAGGLSFSIARPGPLGHGEVLAHYRSHDVFCMPTRHQGEGHTNTVNEAMMMGMVIVATRHGFLESVLAENSAFLLDELTPPEIAKNLRFIHENRDEARRRATAARARLMSSFTSEAAFSNLAAYYAVLTQASH